MPASIELLSKDKYLIIIPILKGFFDVILYIKGIINKIMPTSKPFNHPFFLALEVIKKVIIKNVINAKK